MNKKNMWEILGIHMTTDVALIKEVYAKQAKHAHPEENPEAFMQLQEAFQQAMRFAKMQKQQPDISIAADVFDQSKQEVSALPERDSSSVKMQEYFKEAEWNYHQNQQKLMEKVFSDIKYMVHKKSVKQKEWEEYLNQKEVQVMMTKKSFIIRLIQLMREKPLSFPAIMAFSFFYQSAQSFYEDDDQEVFLVLQELDRQAQLYNERVQKYVNIGFVVVGVAIFIVLLVISIRLKTSSYAGIGLNFVNMIFCIILYNKASGEVKKQKRIKIAGVIVAIVLMVLSIHIDETIDLREIDKYARASYGEVIQREEKVDRNSGGNEAKYVISYKDKVQNFLFEVEAVREDGNWSFTDNYAGSYILSKGKNKSIQERPLKEDIVRFHPLVELDICVDDRDPKETAEDLYQLILELKRKGLINQAKRIQIYIQSEFSENVEYKTIKELAKMSENDIKMWIERYTGYDLSE